MKNRVVSILKQLEIYHSLYELKLNWIWIQFKYKRLSESNIQFRYSSFMAVWTHIIPVLWTPLAVTPMDCEKVGLFSFCKTWNVSIFQWVTTLWSCESSSNSPATDYKTLKVTEHPFQRHIQHSFLSWLKV